MSNKKKSSLKDHICWISILNKRRANLIMLFYKFPLPVCFFLTAG